MLKKKSEKRFKDSIKAISLGSDSWKGKWRKLDNSKLRNKYLNKYFLRRICKLRNLQNLLLKMSLMMTNMRLNLQI